MELVYTRSICEEFGCVIPGLLIVGSIPFGIITGVFKGASNRNKKKSVALFNQLQRAKKNDLSLEFGSTQHGVGFVLRF